MLRDNIATYTEPGLPNGCMVVLAGATYASRTAPIREFLIEARRHTTADIRARLDRGVTDGDLAPDTDTASLAMLYSTVLYGLSIQARDGVSADELSQPSTAPCCRSTLRVVRHGASLDGRASLDNARSNSGREGSRPPTRRDESHARHETSRRNLERPR
ncbi:TetR family transcriptional regulator C-terminal domain-containing protein [Nocardia sp. NPDC058658]|uniref:TetR family transcriptional regulator C-terminal domain-containing protein n=1 Tax=Nocardia sp. NPDC058658 TaxID=3346580 RepID=UPI00365588A1